MESHVNSDQSDSLLTRPEAAKYLGLRPATLEVWAVKGRGPRFIKLGARAVRYRKSDVQAWVNACASADDARQL